MNRGVKSQNSRRIITVAGLVFVLGSLGVFALGGCGGNGSPAPEAPRVKEAPRHVVLFGWDGVQREHLQELIDRGEVPTLRAIAAEGSLRDGRVNTGATDTGAGWVEILTGYSPTVTGIWRNRSHVAVPEGYTVFERLETAFGADRIVTGAICGKEHYMWYKQPQQFYHNAAKHMDFFINGLSRNEAVAARAIAKFKAYRNQDYFIAVVFAEPDITGHLFGENSWQYDAAIRSVDSYTQRMMEVLQANSTVPPTVYITTDHGFDEGENNHHHARGVFVAANEPLSPGVFDRKDLGATLLTACGLDPTAYTPVLEGRALQAPRSQQMRLARTAKQP